MDKKRLFVPGKREHPPVKLVEQGNSRIGDIHLYGNHLPAQIQLFDDLAVIRRFQHRADFDSCPGAVKALMLEKEKKGAGSLQRNSETAPIKPL